MNLATRHTSREEAATNGNGGAFVSQMQDITKAAFPKAFWYDSSIRMGTALLRPYTHTAYWSCI